jgi:DNA mismatch repair protein MutL
MVYTSGDNNLKNCVHEIYGKDYAKNMISVNYEANGIKITGLIGNSTLSRSNRTFQSFFVNGRYVKSSVFSYSLQEGYKNSIMINRFPVAVLQLYLNPSLIDVNVHPTKMEVKFSNDKQIFDAIYWSVKNALYIKRDIPEINITKKSYEYIPSKKEFESITIADKSIKEPYIHPEMREKYISQFNQQEFVLDSNENNKKIDKSVDISYIIEDNIEFKIIGQLFSTYIIIEKDGDMMLIDQHAAHERLIYEKILEKHKKSEIYPQRLISPVVMVLSPSELDIFNSSYEILSKLGFEGEEFGNNSIIVRQSPINVGEEAIRKIVFDIIELIKLNNFNFTTELEEKILYNVACKSAVKGNKKLSFEEMESLVKKVLSLKNINTCPHGRPIIISISKSKIEKEFKRAGI